MQDIFIYIIGALIVVVIILEVRKNKAKDLEAKNRPLRSFRAEVVNVNEDLVGKIYGAPGKKTFYITFRDLVTEELTEVTVGDASPFAAGQQGLLTLEGKDLVSFEQDAAETV